MLCFLRAAVKSFGLVDSCEGELVLHVPIDAIRNQPMSAYDCKVRSLPRFLSFRLTCPSSALAALLQAFPCESIGVLSIGVGLASWHVLLLSIPVVQAHLHHERKRGCVPYVLGVFLKLRWEG